MAKLRFFAVFAFAGLALACSPDSETLASNCGASCGNASATGGTTSAGGGTGNGGTMQVTGGTGGGSGGTGGAEIDIPLDKTVYADVTLEIRIDHLGYPTKAPKRAVVEATGRKLLTFQVVRDSDQKVRLAGNLEEVPGFTDWGGGPNYYVADFSELQEEGDFSVYVNGEFSEVFHLAEHVYFDSTFPAVLDYFKSSRADDSDVWAADASVGFYGATGTRNVQGGWYDASGDISKYLSHLSYANYLNPQQIPLVAWSLAWVKDEASPLLGSRATDVQAEALWGADYLVRVLDPAGFFYVTVFDNWSGSLSARQICAFEGSDGVKTADFQAAFREGGGMAIAALARVAKWGAAGAFTSSQYLTAAETAFAHLQTNGSGYADDGKQNIIDDYTALLAASELYETTHTSNYLTAARARATSLVSRLSAEGYFIADGATRPFWHASDAGLPVVALARYLEVETDVASKTSARNAIQKHLDYLVAVTGATANPYGYARQHFRSQNTVQSGFFIPHDNESGYWWQGENARLASLAAAALIGGRAVGMTPESLGVSRALAAYAMDQIHWILGKNPYDISFLKGYGRNNPPDYCEQKPQHGAFTGGISNGITGSGTNGSGIDFQSSQSPGCGETAWQEWRWVEQWLPHAAWYMVAITAASL